MGPPSVVCFIFGVEERFGESSCGVEIRPLIDFDALHVGRLGFVLGDSGKLRDALDLVNQLGEKLKEAEVSLKKFGEEKVVLEARIVGLGVEKKQAEDDKENHGLEMFAAGFDRAVEQAKFLMPDGDLSRIDPCKVIVGGELVEDDDDVKGQGENPAS
ncbi:hypothetical protein Ahy_B08g092360 [Arachis hypogaea]|uniref:Uncharacterized protein n=1 Tax=Arachis hypogaea TaxID=3818 RepID=A0A444Y3Q7_ARAHY|nr:hypothetical protein Ahy_B08g092360 [Arachis hypogaea]